MKAEVRGKNPSINSSLQNQNPSLFTNSGSSISGCLSSLDGACIEKLLLHCGSALESNDVTLAQQVMWVLNNVASTLGDPNQRLAAYFLRALISRAARVSPTTISFKPPVPARRLMSVTELAGYVDLIPWHRFGFSASNAGILDAVKGFPRVHILDLSITHCMQWPTLIDALGKRAPPPALRISVPSWRPPAPPLLDASVEEIGQRLANFAKYREVPFDFHVVEVGHVAEQEEDDNSYSSSFYDFMLGQLNAAAVKVNADEALVVNVQNWLRYLPDEEITVSSSGRVAMSPRDSFLELVVKLDPCLVTVVDEDCDLGSGGLASRIAACFNYTWIPFDALETFLPKDSRQRIEYESDIGDKIENVVGFEGAPRIERPESGGQLCRRMAGAGFVGVPFGEETVKEVKVLLDEHASGWGMKKDEEDMLVLTWKGHNAVYATAWAPHAPPTHELHRLEE